MTLTQKPAFKSMEQNRATRQSHAGAKDWTKGRLSKDNCVGKTGYAQTNATRSLSLSLYEVSYWAGEMAQWLRSCYTLTEELSLVPRTHADGSRLPVNSTSKRCHVRTHRYPQIETTKIK